LDVILIFVVPRQKYCESLHKTVRRKTRTVMVGNVALGSEHPIRIQTMTTSDTKDITGTVDEVFASVLSNLFAACKYCFDLGYMIQVFDCYVENYRDTCCLLCDIGYENSG